MKNNTISIAAFFIFVIFATFSFAANNEKVVTQGELAKTLAERMDLKVETDNPAECVRSLEEAGIRPAEGWNISKPVTKQALGSILVNAGRLQAEVLAGKDVLKERGIILPEKIDNNSISKVLSDPNVNRLLETPSLSGASIPFPKEGIVVIDRPTPQIETTLPIPEEAPTVEISVPTTEPPTTEVPATEPPTTEPKRPSSSAAP